MDQQQSVTERFANVTPDQFREQLIGLRQAEESFRDAVIEAVENGWITTVQGVHMIAALAPVIYGDQQTQYDMTGAASQRLPVTR